MKCKECDSPDHLVKDCPSRICKNCGEAGKPTSTRSFAVYKTADIY